MTEHQPVDLESLSADWQRALDAAGSALRAAGESLPEWELRDRSGALARETEATAAMLRELARGGRQPAPWLSPTPVTNKMLGLPAVVRACLFDVEGVLTDSTRLHAWAWGEVFDDFLSRLGETTGWHLIPFDRIADYRAYVEGRSRLEGVQTFLRSRGIHVPDGRPDDASDPDSAHGLARRKGELLERRLHEQGVTALPGARRYVEAARRADLRRAVVYESASTLPMLEQAGLASLIDARIDAAVISAEGLRSRPARDILLAACRRLDVPPEHTVTFTASAAGVVAGRRAGMLTVGVGDASQCESLEGFGADRVIPSLGAFLDPRLTTTLEGKL
ncbi:MAG TPA: HAD family phosphatase [Gaiellaceae bacterium]|nr:HAD family phosphatase [Gaiellaceae bacterium]